MRRSIRFGLLSLSLVAVGVLTAAAQTGPTGPGPMPPPAGGNPPAASGFSGEKAIAYLRRQGHTVETQSLANGGSLLKANIQKNGWRFTIEIFFIADNQRPGNQFVDFICPLGQPRTQFSSGQLLELMKLNKMVVTHFFYRESDQRLCLMDANYQTTGMTEAMFQRSLDNFLKTIQDTFHAWDPSRWPVNGATLAAK
jgi:hypothetical protein